MKKIRLALAASLLVAATAVCSLTGSAASAAGSGSATDPGTTPATGTVTVTATRTGTGGGQTGAAAADVISCTFSYDYPHISTYSAGTTINAHLTGKCTAPVTALLVQSTMCHTNLDRCGAQDTTSNGGKDYIQTGGDMTCGPLSRNYQAHGDWSVIWPPGYAPITPADGDIVSPSNGPFTQNADGFCVNG